MKILCENWPEQQNQTYKRMSSLFLVSDLEIVPRTNRSKIARGPAAVTKSNNAQVRVMAKMKAQPQIGDALQESTCVKGCWACQCRPEGHKNTRVWMKISEPDWKLLHVDIVRFSLCHLKFGMILPPPTGRNITSTWLTTRKWDTHQWNLTRTEYVKLTRNEETHAPQRNSMTKT